MSGFDDLPGFGAPPPFLARQQQQQQQMQLPGGAGFEVPAFGALPQRPQMPTMPQMPNLPHMHLHHHHHHHQQPPQQYGQPQYGGQPTAASTTSGGSLFGSAPMMGGTGRHQYAMKSYDLPPLPSAGGGGDAAGAGQHHHHQHHIHVALPPQGGGGGQHRPFGTIAPTAGPRDPTNTVWLGFQDSFISDDDLRTYFTKFGRILRLVRNQPKNCVFVHYAEVTEARSAVEAPETRQFLGHNVKAAYGKMYVYSAEDLEQSERYEQARANRGYQGGANRGVGYGEEARDANGAPLQSGGQRGPRDSEPSNIVWLGDVTAELSTEMLRATFSAFGNIGTLFRAEAKCMAFVHFDTVEQASAAIRALRNEPIAGRTRKMNFGRPQRQDGQGGEGGAGGRRVEEERDRDPPTNVVWLGMLAPTVMQADIDAIFQGYEGFIDADLFPERNYAFGHFESVEQAQKCRQALRGQSLHNVPLRAGFGKQNHSRVKGGRAAQAAAAAPAFDQYGVPILQPPSDLDAFGGALVTTVGPGGQLSILPAEGAQFSVNSSTLVPKYLAKPRPTPTVTLDHKVNTLGGCSYFKCNVPAPYLMQGAVKDVCDAVDEVTSGADADKLVKSLRKHDSLTTLHHLCAVVAKRLKDYFVADPHKKLHVLYAVALFLHEHPKPRPALDAFPMVCAVAAVGQCNDGAAHINRVMKSFRRHLNPDEEADALVLAQFDEVERKRRAETDLGNLLKKIQGK